jgi:hypothetical protein
MVSCVAMVPEMSLGVRSAGGLRTVIGYIYGLSEVWKPRGSACMLFLLFSVPPMVGTTQVSNIILWKCFPHHSLLSSMITFRLKALEKDPLLLARQIKRLKLTMIPRFINALSPRELRKTIQYFPLGLKPGISCCCPFKQVDGLSE